MRSFLLFLCLLLFPSFVLASTLSKKEACSYPEGIHRDPLYIYWPGELPRVDGFLKKDNKLYYFIHIFPNTDAINRYIESDNSPYTKYGFISNKASYMVQYDCSRSRVKFLPYLRSTRGDQYGKFHWIDGDILSYTITSYNAKSSCKYADDIIMDMKTLERYKIENDKNYPNAPNGYCLTRTPYKNQGNMIVRFQVEKYKISTKESWFSLYEYDLKKKFLSQIQ
ncbi:MAG: hypothetical protein HHAS10_05670 [Candidatus Altimarinota bacterium]